MADPPPPPEVHILTLNCWGLKFHLAQHREARLREIGRQLLDEEADIVCLQEIWAHHDYRAVRRRVRARLPYGKFYFSGAFGGGLAVLSRWPLVETSMIPYPLNGRPTAFWRGDWYVGKGVAHARIRASATTTIEVFNTHTHAPYCSSDPADTYRVHREAQAWALAKLLRAAADRNDHPLVVAAGDFNTVPLSPAHRILTAHAPVRDVWRVLHPDSSSSYDDREEQEQEQAPPTAEFNIVENGVTADCVLNTWRCKKPQKQQDPRVTPDPRGQRLDYIFANTAAHPLPDGGGIAGWVVKDARVTMTARHPDLGCSLSDHFAVAATLVYHRTPTGILTTTNNNTTPGAAKNTSPPPIDVASLAGQHWPLPPGRGSLYRRHHQHEHDNSNSNNSHKRKSTPALVLQGSFGVGDHDETSTTTANNNHHHNNTIQREDLIAAAATAPPEAKQVGHDDARSPTGGAFLSLQSPTPSTSRLSLPLPDSNHLGPPLAPDYDTQLLSSLSANPSGDVAFDIHDYDALLSRLRAYIAREAAQTRWRTCHFAFWFCITMICYIVVWVVPTQTSKLSPVQIHAIHFVLLLLSSLGLVAGVLDGLMALLFFRGSEKRALKEFHWELTNARALARGETPGFTNETRAVKY